MIIRGDVERCLIVAPGSLTGQWEEELLDKFGLRFDVVTRDMLDSTHAGDVFTERNRLIVRVDQIARREFKRDVNDNKLVEAVVCLANGDGGTLVLRVEDDGTIVGARPRHGRRTDPARLAAIVANCTSPSVAVAVAVVDVDGLDVVAIEVPKGTGLVRRPLRLDRQADRAGVISG